MTRSPELDAWLSTWSDKIHEWELEITSRGRFEQWLDKHNHVMALLRTVSSFMAAIFSGMVLYLVF